MRTGDIEGSARTRPDAADAADAAGSMTRADGGGAGPGSPAPILDIDHLGRYAERLMAHRDPENDDVVYDLASKLLSCVRALQAIRASRLEEIAP